MEFQISNSALLMYLFAIGCFFSLNAFPSYGSNNTQLIPDEVKVLKALSRKIDNLNWNVTPHSCINGSFNYKIKGEVICNCNFNFCHVTHIRMRGLNLSGNLPSEFGHLTHLQELDLSLNYLNGSIPSSFARLPLVKLCLTSNIIKGQIPKEIGEISTLELLWLGDNELETIPSSLGNLKQLRELNLSYNVLNGQIPNEIGEISTLEVLDMSRNYLNGSIPKSFIGLRHLVRVNLTQNAISGQIPREIGELSTLEVLDLSSNNISGQIPKEIGEISTLKILDLSGNEQIHGSIPNSFVGLRSLVQLDLSSNRISGQIPKEIGEISTLEILDLSYNYLNGSIPQRFGRLPLVKLYLTGNAISGQIPKEIGKISTLELLWLGDNMLEGTLPSSLGNLKQLRELILSGNNLSGAIPESFGNLKKLEHFSINGSSITGKLPNFIGNWAHIQELHLRGTSMEGPIPTAISQLRNLTWLSISGLHGSAMMRFPNLENLKSLQYLELVNCSIHDSIPNYIGQLESLTFLDLSFNMLVGEIPDLTNLNYMFLTQNNLSGKIPEWILENKDNYFDLSYNNFSETPVTATCQFKNINLAASMSSLTNTSLTCMKRNLPCGGKPKYHELFINCGGQEIEFEGNTYEDDTNPEGISSFFPRNDKWAYSSTGAYTREYTGGDDNNYVVTNRYNLSINGSIYQTARVSALSLKYHGLCMMNGSYNVKLHFAEIMFSHEHNSTSLGKRIFDVSIQGKKYLSDFNIMKEAGGVGKGIERNFSIEVNHNNLEIHFYWAGKGTSSVPNYDVYGPLISAISITPNFKINSEISGGAIVGIVVGSCLLIILILSFFLKMAFRSGKDSMYKHLLDLKTVGYFSLRQIKDATNNFAPENKIGEGGFGPVYKGELSDGVAIAVKKLSSTSKQGSREFVNEIGIIFALQHPNLVKLYGCCIEGNQLLLIYEYMDNNNLARALFGGQRQKIHLDWPTRMNICVGIAKGLAYLHEESSLKIVHRDIKATNVLLDKDLNAKISDFGLAKLYEDDNTQITTRIAGTIGYMAPEYAMRGHLTNKADIYSFGVVVLEIASGKSNTSYRPNEEIASLLDLAYVLQEQGKLLELVDPSLGSSYSSQEAIRMLELALVCTNLSPTLRPSMSSVVLMLDGKLPIQTHQESHRQEVMRFNNLDEIQSSSQDSHSQTITFSQSHESEEQREGERMRHTL